MYKVNGFFPLVRCTCGREFLLVRATRCKCRATIRIGGLPKHFRWNSNAPDNYDLKAQPYRATEVIDWVEAMIKL